MTERLKLREPLPSVPGVTNQHPVAARDSWDAPTKLLSQDGMLERQHLGLGE